MADQNSGAASSNSFLLSTEGEVRKRRRQRKRIARDEGDGGGVRGGKRYDMLHEEKNQMEDAGVGAKVWRQEKVNGEEKAVQIEGQVAGLIISKLQDLNLYQSINATFWRRRKKRPLL